MKYLPIILLAVLLLVGPDLLAQCPMCRATAETNLANGGTEGRGLNSGILYLLGMPYVLIGTVAFFWWRNRRKGVDDAVDYRDNGGGDAGAVVREKQLV